MTAPLSVSDRIAIMGEVIGQIQTAGYVYDLGKGASQWAQVPPPRGTRLNCQAAARLAKEMAEKRGLTGLMIVATNIKDGFFVPAAPGMKALGGNEPPIKTAKVSGWEFDNHYRVKDPTVGKVYDPTFGTSGNFNPTGVKCTKTEVQGMKMISVYGNKYKIIRSTVFEAELLSPGPASPQYEVGDSEYR